MDTTKSPTHIPVPNMPLRAAKVQSQVKPCKSSSFGSPKRRHHGTTARIHGENGSKKTSPLHPLGIDPFYDGKVVGGKVRRQKKARGHSLGS